MGACLWVCVSECVCAGACRGGERRGCSGRLRRAGRSPFSRSRLLGEHSVHSYRLLGAYRPVLSHSLAALASWLPALACAVPVVSLSIIITVLGSGCARRLLVWSVVWLEALPRQRRSSRKMLLLPAFPCRPASREDRKTRNGSG